MSKKVILHSSQAPKEQTSTMDSLLQSPERQLCIQHDLINTLKARQANILDLETNVPDNQITRWKGKQINLDRCASCLYLSDTQLREWIADLERLLGYQSTPLGRGESKTDLDND